MKSPLERFEDLERCVGDLQAQINKQEKVLFVLLNYFLILQPNNRNVLEHFSKHLLDLVGTSLKNGFIRQRDLEDVQHLLKNCEENIATNKTEEIITLDSLM